MLITAPQVKRLALFEPQLPGSFGSDVVVVAKAPEIVSITVLEPTEPGAATTVALVMPVTAPGYYQGAVTLTINGRAVQVALKPEASFALARQLKDQIDELKAPDGSRLFEVTIKDTTHGLGYTSAEMSIKLSRAKRAFCR